LLVFYCPSQKKTGKFVSGWSNFRIDDIQAHEVSEQHKAATNVVERPEVKNKRVQDVFTCRRCTKDYEEKIDLNLKKKNVFVFTSECRKWLYIILPFSLFTFLFVI
jgi:hypothetical protein